jgi:hypothetical protein
MEKPKLPSMVVLLLAAISLFCIATVIAEDNAKDNPARVTLTIRLSVDSYDPGHPQGTLTCLLKNDSRGAVFVPGEYDGRQLVIYGRGKTHRAESWLWKPYRPGTDLKPEESVAPELRIDPGETKAVLELSLKEILTPRTGANRSWAWNWPNRTEPPKTPIHGWRRPGFEENASFYAEIQLGKERYRSKSFELSVKSAK